MNNIKNKVDYNFINSLFDKGFDFGKGWKSYYFNDTQRVFKKHFKLLNKWGPNPTDSKKYGIYDENGFWSWMNRINTHPNCCLSFYNWCLEYDVNFFKNFGDPDFHEYNSKKMWDYLDENFDLFFTNKITYKYFSELKRMCTKSWISGNLSVVAIILSLKYAFGDVTNINFTFKSGDGSDMKGIDLSFKLSNGDVKTMQIKSGIFLNMREEFLVKGSANSLTYEEDFYGYVNIDWEKLQLTSVIIFENVKDLYKDEEGYIVVKREFVKYQKIKNMPIPEKLNELFILCGKNNIEFELVRENEKNSITFINEPKKIIVNFSDIKDPQFEKIIDQELENLKNRIY